MFRMRLFALMFAVSLSTAAAVGSDPAGKGDAAAAVDFPRQVQEQAIANDKSPAAYWGTDAEKYTGWKTHSNRLIPVYTFGTKGGKPGVDLNSWFGEASPYRSAEKVQALYGYLPEQTVNPNAVWMDQTNIYDIQKAAADSGKKHIFLVVFDGMDWQTTRAAAVWNQKKVTYTEGRGDGTHFQRYDAAGTTQFGFMVTSAHNEGTDVGAFCFANKFLNDDTCL